MRRFRVHNNKCMLTSWYMYYCFFSTFMSFAMYSKAFRFIITVVVQETIINEKNLYSSSLFIWIPGDSLQYHSGMFFTTYDSDNDNSGSNCGSIRRGGWWYNACHWSNLNGEYGNTNHGEGINWHSWKGVFYSMKEVIMMVRKP